MQQKEPNFLQRNKQALKQNAKQPSLRTNGTSKPQLSSKETSKKANVTKQPAAKKTNKTSTHRQQNTRVINEDSVVISKSALDSLLKQLVDAKQAANTLPPIGNHHSDSIASVHQSDDDVVAAVNRNLQQTTVIPTNYTESQRLQQKEEHNIKHKDLDHSEIPGLSSSVLVPPQKDSPFGEYSSGEH